MLDTNTLLIIIITVLSAQALIFLTAVLLLVRDIRNTIRKVNDILETFNKVARKVSSPITGASNALAAINEGLKAAAVIKRMLSDEKREKRSQ